MRLPHDLHLKNRSTAIIADNELGALSKEVSFVAEEPEPPRTTRRKQQVIVVGDSNLLTSSREVCCLCGAHIQEAVKWLVK